MLDIIKNNNQKSFADGKISQERHRGRRRRHLQQSRANAMSLDMWEGLGQALTELRDEAVRVVVLVGAGARPSSAPTSVSSRRHATTRLGRVRRSEAQRALLGSYPKPTISCIRGFCLGGGMQVAMLTDIRIAAVDSQFGIQVKLGIAYGYDGLRIGVAGRPLLGAAHHVMGMRIDSAEALRIGLVDRVVPTNELWGETMLIASTISGNAPLAIRRPRSPGAGAEGPRRPRHESDQADWHLRHGLLGFPRRPPGLHGKAEAPVQGKIASAIARA